MKPMSHALIILLFCPPVAAMLESETIQGLSSSCPPTHRRSSAPPAHTLPELLQQLGSFHHTLEHYGLSPAVGHQLLRQLLFLVSGTTLNFLLLRKDACSWSRGIQLRLALCGVYIREGGGLREGGCLLLTPPCPIGTMSARWSSGCGRRGCSRAVPVRCWSL